jgi:hypothetical protein
MPARTKIANPSTAKVVTISSIGGFPSVSAEQFRNAFVPKRTSKVFNLNDVR